MLPALTTQRVGAIMPGMTDLASRHEASSFVDYLRSGPAFFVQQYRAAEFKDMAALCGKSVGASRRISFPKEIAAWSDAHCAGNPIEFVGTEAGPHRRRGAGQRDPALHHMQQEPNAYMAVGGPIATQYTGIALPVNDKALQQKMVAAVDALIADGTYKALLARWRLSDNGVDKATINAGP